LRGRRRELSLSSVWTGNSTDFHHSFDIIGDIAVIRSKGKPSVALLQEIAAELMRTCRHVKTVLMQVGPVGGDFRLRSLVHVAGEDNRVTVHKESGCKFKVDVEKCYFSPRLSYERLRVAQLVKPNEMIVNMFAGVGCFSILMAMCETSATVVSIDVNPVAVQFMEENVRVNRVYPRVVPVFGDSKKVVANRLRGSADRVLLPLPEKALEYVPCAVSALKPGGGWIHYYGFEHSNKAENPIEKAKSKVKTKLDEIGVRFEFCSARIIRPTGPNWHQVVVDFRVLGS
jgi:tRNA (guanine37-N1)-methyltransferase